MRKFVLRNFEEFSRFCNTASRDAVIDSFFKYRCDICGQEVVENGGTMLTKLGRNLLVCNHCVQQNPFLRATRPLNHVVSSENKSAPTTKENKSAPINEIDQIISEYCDKLWVEDRKPLPYSYVDDGVEKELFVHWYYKDRSEDKLNPIEIFHTNMLYRHNVMERFDTINLNIVVDKETGITDSIKKVVDILSSGHSKVRVKIRGNNATTWENETIKQCISSSLKKEKYVAYTHFKGVDRVERTPQKLIDIMYWCYLMYRAIFSAEADESIKNKGAAAGILSYLGAEKKFTMKNFRKTFSHNSGSFSYFNSSKIIQIFKKTNTSKKKFLENFDEKYSVEKFLMSFFDENEVFHLCERRGSQDMYLLFTTDFYPKFIKDFKRFCKPSVLVYTYAENLKQKVYVFTKNDGVDYVIFSDGCKSNYENEDIDYSKGDTVWKRNKWYKWHPSEDYDYVIYRDISMDILDVYGLIKHANSRYGINLHRHPGSHSIKEENEHIANLFRVRNKEYDSEIVENISGIFYDKQTDMLECTVIVYNTKKLNKTILEEFWKDFESMGAVRDQPAFRYTLFKMNIDAEDVTTLQGHIPWNSSISDKDKNLKATSYYKVV